MMKNAMWMTWVLAAAVATGCGGETKDKDPAKGGDETPKAAEPGGDKGGAEPTPAADEQPSSGTTGPGSWKRITKDDAYKPLLGAVIHGGALYHAVVDGTLYKTDLATGKIDTVSRKPDFGGIRWFMQAGETMLSIDKNGTVYKITADASRAAVGKAGNYKDTIAAGAGDGKLYTIERDGRFFITDLGTMGWSSLKKADYANTRYMLATDGHVVTVEKDGSAFKVDPTTGKWWNLGPNELWKGTKSAAFHAGKLYRIAANGALNEVELAKGANTPLGKPDFEHVVWMGSDGTSLITLEKDGSLYRVATE